VLVNVTDALNHDWRADHALTAGEAALRFEAAFGRATLGLDRRVLFDRLRTRPKVRSFLLFGHTLVQDGESLQLQTAVAWPTPNCRVAGRTLAKTDLIARINEAGMTMMGVAR
jgi:hypothetical protein